MISKRTIGVGVMVLGCATVVVWDAMSHTDGPMRTLFGGLGFPQEKAKPRFTIGKETTYVTGPVAPDGYIDYAAALNKIMSKGVTPENNANVLLWKAIGPQPGKDKIPPEYFQELGMAVPAQNRQYFTVLYDFLIKKGNYNPDKDSKKLFDQDRARERPWTSKQYPHITEWLKAQEKPMAIVVDATKRSHFFAPLIVPDTRYKPNGLYLAELYTKGRYREFGYALVTRAMLHLGEKRPKKAWQDLLAAHRLARLVSKSSHLSEVLMGNVVESVACHADLVFLEFAKPNVRETKSRLADLLALSPMPPVAEYVNLCERFTLLDSVMLLDRCGLKLLVSLAASRKPLEDQSRPLTGKIDLDPAMRRINDWFDKLNGILNTKDRNTRAEKIVELEGKLKSLSENGNKIISQNKTLMNPKVPSKLIGDLLVGLLFPAVTRTQFAFDRIEQLQLNRNTAFALAAYKADHGNYPKKLDELTPKYLKQIPRDIFSDNPLIYRPSANGYLLYSVGENGKDDNGKERFENEENWDADDLRIIMPLPKLKK